MSFTATSPPTSNASLWQYLTTGLRTMDAEATSTFVEAGRTWPTGLRQYHHHWRRNNGGRRRCEESWSQRLGQLLVAAGLVAQAEGRGLNGYPPYALPVGKRWQKCDLRVSLSRTLDLWLEVKGAWPVVFDAGTGGEMSPRVWGRHQTYFLDETIEDLRKLDRLRQPDASTIGLLRISFDHELASVDALLPRAAEDLRSWTLYDHDRWREPHYGTDVGVRLYLKQVGPSRLGHETAVRERAPG